MKPTKQQVLDEPAGPRLDAWFCKYVLGNKFKSHLNPFYPSTNIYHAMEGVEKWKKTMTRSGILGNCFMVSVNHFIWHNHTFISDNIEDVLFNLNPLNLTRALLLWAIEKDK